MKSFRGSSELIFVVLKFRDSRSPIRNNRLKISGWKILWVENFVTALYCPYTVLILSLYCPYTVLTLSLHCPYTVLTLSLHCPYTVLTLSLYRPHTVLILSSYCPHTVLILSLYCPLVVCVCIYVTHSYSMCGLYVYFDGTSAVPI